MTHCGLTWLGFSLSASWLFAEAGPRAHAEGQIALGLSKQDRLRPDPG
ncbi:MAG: hypothetical protein LZF62_320161 [Nitrospira sp.]|nr:MAG: hypothetical protein LZF62_320161 [Nitrospira sp.]